MAGVAASHQSTIKAVNKKRVIRALWENSPVSRTGLARLTGLNKATITNLIGEIEADGMIRNVGQQHGPGAGRNANLIMLNERYGVCAAITVRTREFTVSIGNIFAETLWERKLCHTPADNPMDVLERTAALLHEGIAACSAVSSRLFGICIGAGSLVRHPDDMIYAMHSTLKWYNVPLGEFFRSRFAVPIRVDTGSNFAMLGEVYFGSAKGVSNALFITSGLGIGGSLLIDGQIYRGANGFAGDIGHFSIDPNGPLCPCGNRGCWEIMGSALALAPDLPLDEAIRRAEQGDVGCIGQFSRIGQNLGRGIANLTRVLNPERVIIGGDIVLAGKWVMNPCRTELQTRLWPFVWERTELQFSTLGNRSILFGCYAGVLEPLFTP